MNRLTLLFSTALVILNFFINRPAVAQTNYLIVSSADNSRVICYDTYSAGMLEQILPGSTPLSGPQGVAFGPDGNIYVACVGSNSVLRYDSSTRALLGAFVPTNTGGLQSPTGIVFGPDGNLYVSSHGTDSVLKFNGSTGAFISAFASGGGLDGPQGITFGPDGNLYVSSEDNDRVLRFNGVTGSFIDSFVPAGLGGLNQGKGIAFGPDGNLYVSSSLTSQVLRYNGSTGAFLDVFVAPGTGGMGWPTGLTFGPDGNLYVISRDTLSVLRFDASTGAPLGTAAELGLAWPTFLAFKNNLPPTHKLDISPITLFTQERATLTWNVPAGASATDWVGLYRVGDPHSSFLWWQYTNGATTGTVQSPPISAPGQYQFRYFLNNGYSIAAASRASNVTLDQGLFSLSINTANQFPGGPLTVTWSAPSGRPPDDWIGFYEIGATDREFLWFGYTNGAQTGSFTLPAPSKNTSYQWRYFTRNTYTRVASSSFVRVDGSYTLSATPTTVAPGATITVNWTAPSGSSSLDWIGLYPEGEAENRNYLWPFWFYTNGVTSGSRSLAMPTTPGRYVFRYLLNNGWTSTAQSGVITVQ